MWGAIKEKRKRRLVEGFSLSEQKKRSREKYGKMNLALLLPDR